MVEADEHAQHLEELMSAYAEEQEVNPETMQGCMKHPDIHKEHLNRFEKARLPDSSAGRRRLNTEGAHIQ